MKTRVLCLLFLTVLFTFEVGSKLLKNKLKTNTKWSDWWRLKTDGDRKIILYETEDSCKKDYCNDSYNKCYATDYYVDYKWLGDPNTKYYLCFTYVEPTKNKGSLNPTYNWEYEYAWTSHSTCNSFCQAAFDRTCNWGRRAYNDIFNYYYECGSIQSYFYLGNKENVKTIIKK